MFNLPQNIPQRLVFKEIVPEFPSPFPSYYQSKFPSFANGFLPNTNADINSIHNQFNSYSYTHVITNTIATYPPSDLPIGNSIGLQFLGFFATNSNVAITITKAKGRSVITIIVATFTPTDLRVGNSFGYQLSDFSAKVQMLSLLLQRQKVTINTLLLPNGNRKENEVRGWFHQDDIPWALGIKLSLNRSDWITWSMTPNGIYSVASGYKLRFQNPDLAECSNKSKVQTWWKFIWGSCLTPKMKNVIWRVFNHWIPTKVELVKRGMALDTCCDLCKFQEEDICHALWLCLKVQNVWKQLGFPKLIPLKIQKAADGHPRDSQYQIEIFSPSSLQEPLLLAVQSLSLIPSIPNRPSGLKFPFLTCFSTVSIQEGLVKSIALPLFTDSSPEIVGFTTKFTIFLGSNSGLSIEEELPAVIFSGLMDKRSNWEALFTGKPGGVAV
ncbi:hypothetical protein G4B88_021048 [Cannabis sativa]|uniref:Reverse transcriptase zinc-binding domain-containing protein n=1 Tax=Cannabis sativa TaxID=3483 RepID=A0A7J6HX05_CANSA|nr:hypothetical protein G4B88_021048 [Cannabis sativa]